MSATPAMALRRVADATPQPWRNGGGRTRELLAWPPGADWRVRVSVAEIDADGPFSAFEGVERWFAVLSGAGVVLSFAHGRHRLTPASAPLRFDGGEAPACRLIDDATSDLNLMLRVGVRGELRRAVRGEPWAGTWRWRAAFTAGAARFESGDDAAVALEAGTLLAPLAPGPCMLVAHDDHAPMFWIGASLDVGTR